MTSELGEVTLRRSMTSHTVLPYCCVVCQAGGESSGCRQGGMVDCVREGLVIVQMIDISINFLLLFFFISPSHSPGSFDS